MKAAIIGAAEVPYTRHPAAGSNSRLYLKNAVQAVLQDVGLTPRDVDGLAVTSFGLEPDRGIDLAWRLGLSLRWLMQDYNGGASGINMLGHAVRGIEAGAASVVVIVSGDSLDPQGQARLSSNYNSAVRDHLTPLGHGGPNSLFAMLTQRQMRAHGLTREDYGRVVIAQRDWATRNPGAVYRAPLSMEDYLGAPLVADPLTRLDCVPTVSGANALVVASEDRCPPGRPRVRVRALRQSFNHDHQLGDGLQTGLSRVAADLWSQAGVAPADIDLACLYDDYPAIVLAQLNDLGIAENDIPRFVRERIAARSFPLNTSGGLLSAGQGGAAGALHGLTEAVRQLQHRAGERQVENARLAVASGYGMVLYRYAANAGAAVLERVA